MIFSFGQAVRPDCETSRRDWISVGMLCCQGEGRLLVNHVLGDTKYDEEELWWASGRRKCPELSHSFAIII